MFVESSPRGTATGVSVSDCYFNVNLTPSMTLSEQQPELFVEVAVEGVTLEGRIQIGTTPYAAQAAHADRATAADNGVPPGTIVAFGGTTPPEGWLLCDGTALDGDEVEYAALYAAIGTAWGTGSGAIAGPSGFNLPDLRGRFLRGVEGTAGRDPDASARTSDTLGNEGNAVGSIQDDAFAAHDHEVNDPGHSHDVVGQIGCVFPGGGSECAWRNLDSVMNIADTASAATGISVDPSGDSETRPDNAYVNYIIKL